MNLFRSELPFIEALLRVRPTAAGGRRHPVFPGYRAGWWVPQPDGSGVYADGPIDLVGLDELAPGNEGSIRIYPLTPELWNGVEVGTGLTMCEGDRAVGDALVTALHLVAETVRDRS